MTVTILDGGMGRELHRRGAPFRQPEWSALALMEAPDIVRETHLDFLQAGAQVDYDQQLCACSVSYRAGAL